MKILEGYLYGAGWRNGKDRNYIKENSKHRLYALKSPSVGFILVLKIKF